MNLKPIALALAWGISALALQASDLTPEVTARFLKVIATTSGQTRIACLDGAVKTALEAQGIPVETGAGIVWCTTLTEARMQKQAGKLVVVGRRELTPMACIVLAEEGGRPKLVLNTTNIRACKITLGDALMRIGDKL